jgi:hypothetical protein
MSNSQDDNPKNKRHKVVDEYVSMMDNKPSIHSASYSAGYMEGAQEKELDVTEGKDIGSWQFKKKSEI